MNRSSSWQCFEHFPCTVFLINAALVIRTRTSFSVHMFCVPTHAQVHRINMFVFNRNMIVYIVHVLYSCYYILCTFVSNVSIRACLYFMVCCFIFTYCLDIGHNICILYIYIFYYYYIYICDCICLKYNDLTVMSPQGWLVGKMTPKWHYSNYLQVGELS